MLVFDFCLTFAKYALLIVVPYLAFVIGYRLFLHPLSPYSGPRLAKVSGLYAGFHALGMRLHLVTYLDLKKYGPVIRHSPNRLVFSSPQALRDIYNNERVTKSHVYEQTVSSGKPSIFNAIDKQKHRQKHKLVGQSINEKAMRSFEPTMVGQIDVFLEQVRLASKKSEPLNMTDLTKRLGADIVGHLAFGYALNTQTDPTNRFVLKGLAIGAYKNNSWMQWPILKNIRLQTIMTLIGSKLRKMYEELLRQMITSRLSQEKHAKNDLYSFVADHLDDPTVGVTTSELWSEAVFFFPAGGDTVTTAMSALFFYLAQYREVYNKLAREIRETFASEDSIRSGPQLASCRYLRACIDEALRISPPVGGTLWRELYSDELNNGPFIVDGHVIPPGTQVGVNTYALHHDEQYFDDPFTFRPERWLTEDRATLSRMNSAFTPFSMGARGCAGKAMAYLEASLVIAKALWCFGFELAPGKQGQVGMGRPGKGYGRHRPKEFQLYDTFGSRHDGPNLMFRERDL